MSSNERGQREADLARVVPVKISGPTGHRVTSDTPIPADRWGLPPAPPVDPWAAIAAAKVEAEQAAEAERERLAQRKALGEQQLETVRTYAAEVAAFAQAAAALKSGPPAPLHIREAARAILHGGPIRPWSTVNYDPIVLQLLTLREQGRSFINGGLDALTAAGRAELDIAECAAHATLIARARIVAGEG